MKLMDMLPADSVFVAKLTKKLSPPLVTLLSMEPEVIYSIYIYTHIYILKYNFFNF